MAIPPIRSLGKLNLAANGMTLLALLGAAFPVYHLYKRRTQPGAVYLLLLCIALVIYPFNLILLEGESAVLLRLSVVAAVAPLYFLALFSYLRFAPSYWARIRLCVLVYLSMAVTAPWLWGDLFIDFPQVQPRADIKEYVYKHGPIVWVMKVCSYALVLVAGAAVLQRFNSSRSNGAHVLSMAVFPLCTALLDLLAVLVGFSTYHGVTAFQVSATLTLFVLSYALMRHQMLERVPVSRNTLMSYLREGICVISEQGEVADCNDAMATMIGVSMEELSGQSADAVLPKAILSLLTAYRGHGKVHDVEVKLNSGSLYLSITVTSLEDGVTLLLSATDITERKLMLEGVSAKAGELRDVNEQLEAMSVTDPLTGLGNRRKLQNALRDSRQSVDAQPMGLIMVDIDHFKAINDTHGHDAGDLVLIALAAAMADVSRENDLVVRWGGEEFVVLMVGSDERRLQVAAERMRLHIRQLSIALRNGVTLQVTASIGATMMRPGQSSESALRDVDRLMYAAKQNGRDCVRSSRRAVA